MNFTENEKTILNALLDICFDSAFATISDLVDKTNIPATKLRGVLGSLVKKGKACTETEEVNFKNVETIYPVITFENVKVAHGFLCDDMEYNQLKKYHV